MIYGGGIVYDGVVKAHGCIRGRNELDRIMYSRGAELSRDGYIDGFKHEIKD